MLSKEFELQVKAVGEEGVFEGYASTFGGAPDSYGDVITPGAFAKSLAQHRRKGTMPMMFFGHNTFDLPIGDWVDMAEDGKGLWSKGRLAIDDPTGSRVYAALKAKRVRGLSIGYRVEASHQDDKAPGVTYLDEIDLREVSIVNLGANERALVTDVKTGRIADFVRRLRAGEPPETKEFEDVLGDLGIPKALRAGIASRGYAKTVRRESEGDKAADAEAFLRALRHNS